VNKDRPSVTLTYVEVGSFPFLDPADVS